MDPSVLRDRLREVVRGTAPASPPLPAAAGNRARSFDDLGGAWRETAAGRSFVVSRRVDPDAAHGSQPVRTFGDRLRLAEPSAMLVGANLARAPFLFFDLETTGLNGGAGTCAFLVGCGWFDEDGAFVTEQHLLMDYAGEPAMLRGVAEQVAGAGALVTFNGKSFDAPVLETRYLFHRLTSPCTGLAHVDLLHPARRFWGSTDEAGCSLVALEARLLGLRRKGDVPGFEIPARYFHFVRSGDARPLAAVLEHNRLDLLSLAGLTARLFALVDSGPAQAGDAKEALALARVYERAGLDERAEASLRARGNAGQRYGDEDRRATRPGARRAPSAAVRRGGRALETAARYAGLSGDLRARGDRGAGHPSRAPGARSGCGENVCVAGAGSGNRKRLGRCRAASPGANRAENRQRVAAVAVFFAAFAACLRLSDVWVPNFFVNRSTRPSVSISF